jgi:hypothetical protein
MIQNCSNEQVDESASEGRGQGKNRGRVGGWEAGMKWIGVDLCVTLCPVLSAFPSSGAKLR